MSSEQKAILLRPRKDAHLTALCISLAGPFYYYLIYDMFQGTMNQNGVYGGNIVLFLALTMVPLLLYCIYIFKNITKIHFAKSLHYPFMLLSVFFGVALAGAGAWGGGWMMFIAMGVVPLMILPAIGIVLTGIALDISYLQKYRQQQRDAASPDS